MKKRFQILTLSAALCVLAGTLYAGVSRNAADMSVIQAPTDPKKKKAGEECKAANECQRHHACDKIGEKSVCTAPPPIQIPNT